MSQDNIWNRQLVLKNDFYVKQSFIGNSPNFIITNGMLYQKFQGYILQQKENASEESAFFWEPEDLGIDIEKIDDKYPIESKSWLMYFGIRENPQTNKFIQEAFILPQFNQPKILILNPDEIWDYRNEYFFYHDQKYLVYMKLVSGVNYVIYEIYSLNGLLVQTLSLNINGLRDHTSSKIIMSPSGQYIFYVEDTDKLIQGLKLRKPVGKILELVQDSTNKRFEFKLRRTIKDFYKRFKMTCDEINSNYFSSIYEFYVTDDMEILYVNKTHNKLMYEGVELQSEIYRKFGKKSNNNSYRDLSNVSWVPKNGGFAFYTKTQAYFLRINAKIKTVLPLVEVKFRINKTQMIIEKICPWLDPNLIVILLKIK